MIHRSHINRMSRGLLCACLLVMIVQGRVLAAGETASAGDSTLQSKVFQLGEIEVVGDRKDQSRNTTVEKIYDDEMRLFDKNDLADAVNLLPGVTLTQAGARNEMMVDIRGFNIKHVPIFLDGVPIYVPYDGYPDLSRFNTFNLSEITVSKGFTSVLYGPNTMGGAINMVSRRPTKEFEMNAGTGITSDQNYTEYANFGSNHGTWYIQGGGSYVRKNYYDLSDDFNPTALQGKGARVNSYETDWSGNIKLGLTPNTTDEYALSYINQQAEKGVPPYVGASTSESVRFWRWPYWDHQSLYFNSTTSVLDKNYVKTRFYYDTFNNSLYSYDDATYSTMTKRSSFESWYDDSTYGGSLEAGTKLLPGNLIKLAFHYKDDIHKEHNGGYPVQHFEDRIYSLGIEDTIDITKKLYTIVGLGYDRVDTVKAQDLISKTKTLKDFPLGATEAYTPQVGLFYKLSQTDAIHVSVAEKSRLPSIKDKFSYRLGTAIPNPDLEPEKSINYETGYKGLLFGKMIVEANLFYSDISDYILLETIPDPDNSGKTIKQNRNVGDVNQYGVELSVSGRILHDLEGAVSYTYLQYDNKSSNDKLTDIPHTKIFASLRYFTPIKALSFLGSLQYNTDRYSSSDGERIADAYTLIDVKAMYDLATGITLTVGIDNLTDQNWELTEGYPLAGRTCFANLAYHY